MASNIEYPLHRTSSSKLTKLEVIGFGGYCSVYTARHSDWGLVAVKQFLEGQRVHKRVQSQLMLEAENLARVKHKNIVSFLGMIMEDQMCALILHYLRHGSLHDFLQNEIIHWPLKIRMVSEIILAMNYLHTIDPAIIHRDLKSQNVLVDEHFSVQITDFGISEMRTVSRVYSLERGDAPNRKGTLPFIPPESWIDANLKPNTMSDVYSFGILLWEILTEKLPYLEIIDDFQLKCAVIDGQRPDLNEIPDDAPPFLHLMMVKCWGQNPKARPTFRVLQIDIDKEMEQNNYETEARNEEIRLLARRQPEAELGNDVQEIEKEDVSTTILKKVVTESLQSDSGNHHNPHVSLQAVQESGKDAEETESEDVSTTFLKKVVTASSQSDSSILLNPVMSRLRIPEGAPRQDVMETETQDALSPAAPEELGSLSSSVSDSDAHPFPVVALPPEKQFGSNTREIGWSSPSILKQIISSHSYKHPELTQQEIQNVSRMWKDLKLHQGDLDFTDGSRKRFLCLTGTLPVCYKGTIYHTPICVWLSHTHPINPPTCYLKPISSMRIVTGRHVDTNGLIYLPYLHEWKYPKSDLMGLIEVMLVVFGEDPPLRTIITQKGEDSPRAMICAAAAEVDVSLLRTVDATMKEIREQTLYMYPLLAKAEILNVFRVFKDLRPVLEFFVFNDGTRQRLMHLNGTIPVCYKGNTYHTPICIWLMKTHPYDPPMCYVRPISSMRIKTGRHVDSNGQIYMPYLHDWKYPGSDLLGLIEVMVTVFGEEPPVYTILTD